MRTPKTQVRDRITELIRVRAGDLVDHPLNWRVHPRAQQAAVRGLLSQIGYADALLARRDRGKLVLIDGHLRKSLDPDQMVPVLVLDVTSEEAETLLATLDPLTSLAHADAGVLSELLSRVQTSSTQVAEFLESLAHQAHVPLGLDLEQIPERVKAQTRPGDLWVIGEHRLVCGDARSKEALTRLMAGDQADLLITDPPYGVSYRGKTSARLRIQGDSDTGLEELLRESFSAIDTVLAKEAGIYVFHPAGPLARIFLDGFCSFWKLRQQLVWSKGSLVLGRGDYHYAHEPILYGCSKNSARGRGRSGWYGGNDQSSVLEVPRPVASRDHPTAKPVELMRRLLGNSSRRGQVVLDPFAGSGSTLLACQVLSRRGRAMEIDPTYCDVILARLKSAGLTAVRQRRTPR